MTSTLYKTISIFASLLSLKILIKLSGINTIYPFYHIVSDHVPIHIKHLYKIRNIKKFKTDIQYLTKNFSSIDTVPHNIYRQDKASFLLSFDDGLRECYEIILPILDEHNINAIFFINSDFADNKAIFFKYKASILCEHLNTKAKDEEIITKASNILGYNKTLKIKELRRKILKIPYSKTDVLNKLAELFNISFDEYQKTEKPYMSRDEIIESEKSGHLIGAHGTDHPLFSEIDTADQIKQVSESTDFINDISSGKLKLFAFPFTDHHVGKSFFEEIQNKSIVDHTFGTAGIKKDSAKNNIQRIPVELHGMSAKRTIKTEYFLYIIKRLIGKHKIIRN